MSSVCIHHTHTAYKGVLFQEREVQRSRRRVHLSSRMRGRQESLEERHRSAHSVVVEDDARSVLVTFGDLAVHEDHCYGNGLAVVALALDIHCKTSSRRMGLVIQLVSGLGRDRHSSTVSHRRERRIWLGRPPLLIHDRR